jgi:2-polyprenyl-3-methyl-5-hydroxy-6-metoxy-1,4-benzoquinol methylase
MADLTFENCLEPLGASILEEVSKYYGTVLQKSDDLKTSACCISDGVPTRVKKLLCNIHDEVMMKYYGCGLIVPESLQGASIVDLGCGAGRDVYTLAQLVGPTGSVTGVDMTDEQLEVARRTLPWHMEKFGYSKPNVQFLKSEVENLSAIPDASVDVVVSNCVVNLSPDKRSIL